MQPGGENTTFHKMLRKYTHHNTKRQRLNCIGRPKNELLNAADSEIIMLMQPTNLDFKILI